MHRCYGYKDWGVLFEDAIKHAEEGFHLTEFASGMMQTCASRLSRFPSRSIVLDDSGDAPEGGSLFCQPLLAASLRKIAMDAETFYTGELAELIVSGLSDFGGIITADDLAKYSPSWTDPIHIFYRGRTVYAPSLNSTAFQILQTPKFLEQFDLSDMPPWGLTSFISFSRQPRSRYLIVFSTPGTRASIPFL